MFNVRVGIEAGIEMDCWLEECPNKRMQDVKDGAIAYALRELRDTAPKNIKDEAAKEWLRRYPENDPPGLMFCGTRERALTQTKGFVGLFARYAKDNEEWTEAIRVSEKPRSFNPPKYVLAGFCQDNEMVYVDLPSTLEAVELSKAYAEAYSELWVT